MKFIQYGVFVGLMMASIMPVAQGTEMPANSHQMETAYRSSAGSLPSITVADQILVTPAPTVTLSSSSSSSDSLTSTSSSSVSNALAVVEINGQSIQSGGAQVIFQAP